MGNLLQSGQLRTSRDDHIIRRIAVRSLRSSCKKIKEPLLAAGRNVSILIVSSRLRKEIGLSSRIANGRKCVINIECLKLPLMTVYLSCLHHINTRISKSFRNGLICGIIV